MTTPLHAEPVWRIVPVDTGPNFSDSTLPLAMIEAGMGVQDQIHHDTVNYVAGETTDWDEGMIAVAIYRAMLAAAPAPAVARERVPGCVCTFIGEWDGYSGVVAHHSGPWPVWIDKSCPVHGAAPTQGGGQLSGNTGELAEAVEIVTEWLAMAEAVPTQTHGVLRYPPISQGELDAIALLAKGGGT